jgi:hypothetical protein
VGALLTRRMALALGGAALITPAWADGIQLRNTGVSDATQGIRLPPGGGAFADPHRDQTATLPAHFTTAASPQTLTTLTISAGLTNSFLIAGIVLTSATAIGAVTWGAQTMTAIGNQTNGSARAYLYGLINPTAGNQTLSVAFTGTASGNLFATSYRNINQATPTYGFAQATATGTAAAVSVVSAAADVCVDCISALGQVSAPAKTKLTIDNTGFWGFGMSEATGAASVAFAWTNGSSSAWVDIACALKDAGAPACSNSLDFTQACNSQYIGAIL